MKIVKRSGKLEELSFDKILQRLKQLSKDKKLGELKNIDVGIVAQKVISSIYDGVSSQELDEEAARISISITDNLEYPILASRIVISNLHKSTLPTFSDTMELLYKDEPVIGDDIINIVRKYKEQLDENIKSERDYMFDYFGFKTLEKSYLMKKNGNIVERPQYMYMRIAVGIHKDNLDKILKTYDLISQHYYTHASPTMFNSGTRLPNLSSCFHGDTLVYTHNRGYVKIKDVLPGDEVITHKNNLKKVVQVHENLLGDRKLYNLYISNILTPITVTGNHRLWVYREGVVDWIAVENLQDTDYIATPNLFDIYLLNYKNEQMCYHNNTKFLRYIKKIEVSERPEYVYTLGVEDDHSYSVGGIIAENCFLLGTDDSIEGIYKTITDCARISKVGGGIGVHVTNIRSKGSKIVGTNGTSDGIIPMLKVYNSTASYVNQSGKRKGSFACFVKDTKVFTTNEGVKNIQDVKVGDQVVTHKNRIRQVTQVHKNELGDRKLYKVKIQNNKDIYVTGDHRLWSYHAKNKLKSQEIGWNSVEELKKILDHKESGCYVCIPNSNGIESVNPQHLLIDNDNGMWVVNDDLVNLFGIWLGYGCIKKNNKNIDGIQFTIPKDNTKLIEFIERTCKNAFKCTSTICYSKKSLVCNVSVNSRNVGEVFEEMFGSNVNRKHLPDFVYSWSKEWIYNLIAGMSTTNEYITKKKTKTDIKIGLSNETLMIQLFHLCRSNGIKVTYPTRGGQTCPNYTMSISKCQSKHLKIISITESDRRDDFVYTLGVEEDHSYTVEGILAENCYIEPWHADILEFLELKKNQGHDDVRARDLFYAMWIPDLFMKKVLNDEDWYLMCPNESKGLTNSYGEEFEKLYDDYVKKGLYREVVKARDVWTKILDAQIETGVPYLCYKDSVNRKCNQKNLGTIKSSNLCAEISLYSDDKEYAVCFTGDTKILTIDGYKRIDECDNKYVVSYFDNDINLKENLTYNKATLIDNGVKDVYTLTCYGTKPIKATYNHLFLTVTHIKNQQNYYEWKKLGELKENDKILLPCTDVLPSYHQSDMSYDDEYLSVGWMLGDGWQSKGHKKSIYGVCFGPNDVYAKDRVVNTLTYMTNKCEYLNIDKNGVYNWASSKYNFIQYMKDNFGLYEHTAHYKIIPECIKNSAPNQICSFLSGLFSADGTVYINNNKFYIALSSSSETLLYDVQELLRCFGIESRVVYGYAKTKNNYQGKLTIEPIESIKRFSKYINFELSHAKKLKLENGLNTINKRNVYRSFAKVKSVVYYGREKVYDLSVPNTHNFIAEGQVVHNCNLASLSLPKFVEYSPQENKPTFNFDKFVEVCSYIIDPMNDVIDNNYYPTEETKQSNMKHRPLGIGIQGLTDVYLMFRYPFDSDEAKKLNIEIFEALYYGCLKGSLELSKKYGPYSTFSTSPFSQGKLQFDLAHEYDKISLDKYISGRFDWDSLKNDIKKYGVRNSMLTALMPTASSSQIMGNFECFEWFDSCIYKRRVLSGEYTIINKYLIKDLEKLGLWSKEMKEWIITNNGSIQDINVIPDDIKNLYKNVWEISMKNVIEQSRDRGVFIDQMQSMNLFMANPTYKKLTSMHFYAWENGLKTGMYYLRSKSSSNAAKFNITPELEKTLREKQEKNQLLPEEEKYLCSIDNKDACELCSS